ncbi:MAG: FAD-dependent oxidoreductase [Desulfatitalea sp.]|nr:FAD-dependent oxidoreductase [Desulfatitalea sp.]
MGIPITLVDTEANLDRKLASEAYRLESGVPFNYAHRPGLIRILRNANIRCVLPATIQSAKHSSQGFRVQIERRATYVDPTRCTLCGQCVSACPVCAGESQRPIQTADRMALPGRVTIDKRRQPLCQANCPLGVNVQGYMALTAAGRYEEALELIRQENVLPAVCGRICTHPCEAACRRGEKEGPLAIRDIKRFVADRAAADRLAQPKAELPADAPSVAIVGSGPAGLAAATDLARRGFAVTVYEKESEAGGLLRYGIGPHRLPRKILDAELDAIQAEGVRILTGQNITLLQGLEALRQKHRAVILTTGAWADRKLGVAGEALEGVQGCLSFLSRFYRGDVKKISGRAAVIGDGNAAYDLARVLRRLGVAVTLVSWFAAHEIPADVDEVEAAAAEGIALIDRRQVVGFSGEKNRFRALRVQATQPGPAAAKGICWPILVPDAPVEELAFEHAFVAIGQGGPYRDLAGQGQLAIDPRGLLAVDEQGRTALDGVYAAGDAATGATSVVTSPSPTTCRRGRGHPCPK